MAQEDLRTYYNYFYPFDTLVNWLTYNGRTKLSLRQLSFQYQGIGVERYVTFKNANQMKTRMISTRQNIPLKVDAGAIWNRTPQKDSSAKTVQRQLIFDFDMNDYDDVRTCCEGKKVCVKCWKLLVIAVEVIQKALSQDFDFHQLMYVFSGGRGLHIWVCDKRARQMKDSLRKAIVDYLQLVTGNDKSASLLSDKVINNLEDIKKYTSKQRNSFRRNQFKEFYLKNQTSAHVQRSLAILKSKFYQIMEEQHAFQSQKCLDLMMKIISNRSQKLKQRIQQRWYRSKSKNSKNMFEQMQDQIIKYECSPTIQDYASGRKIQDKQEIILSFLYPRMDYNVSTMQNHLLKLPFSIHPTSKKVSIPLFKKQLDKFNPKSCVQLGDLLKNLQQLRADNLVNFEKNEDNAMKTDLIEAIKALQQFINSMN